MSKWLRSSTRQKGNVSFLQIIFPLVTVLVVSAFRDQGFSGCKKAVVTQRRL